jgi:hypothetical protein
LGYTLKVVKTVAVELDANELKLLLVAIRQVKHTTLTSPKPRAAPPAIARSAVRAVQKCTQLERKFADLMDELSQGRGHSDQVTPSFSLWTFIS